MSFQKTRELREEKMQAVFKECHKAKFLLSNKGNMAIPKSLTFSLMHFTDLKKNI